MQLLKKMGITGLGLLLTLGTAYAQTVGNRQTGYESENNASIETENELDVDNDNDLDLENLIRGHLATGDNEAECNTGDGMVDTGSATGRVSITNRGNSNLLRLRMSNDNDSDWSIMNDTTGAESENNAWVRMENKLDIDNNNDADVNNNIDVSASTGGNEASHNTGDGIVVTGNASLDISVVNDLNSNEVVVD